MTHCVENLRKTRYTANECPLLSSALYELLKNSRTASAAFLPFWNPNQLLFNTLNFQMKHYIRPCTSFPKIFEDIKSVVMGQKFLASVLDPELCRGIILPSLN